MVATKRRFNPNLQRVRILVNGVARRSVRLHAVPEGREGPEGPLAGARALVGAALAALEASRERIDNLNVYPRPGRGHGHEHDADRARGPRRARGLAGGDGAGRGPRGHARLPHGRARELGRDPLPARPRRGRGARRDRAGRRGGARRLPARRERRRLRGRPRAAGGDDPHRRARARRAGGGAPERHAARGRARRARRGTGRRRSRARPSSCAVLREAGVVDAGGAGLLELVRGIAAHARGEPLPGGAGDVRAAAARRDPPGALALPLLHELLRRGPRGRSRPARAGASGVRRLACSSSARPAPSRPTSTRTTRAARSRSRPRPASSPRSTSRTCTCRRRSGPSACSRQAPERRASAVVAVVAGAGNAALFRSLGATQIVAGGQTHESRDGRDPRGDRGAPARPR